MVSFNYGPWDHFQELEKDSEALYVLDNGQIYKGELLLDTVNAVFPGWTSTYSCDDNGFIDESLLPASYRLHFFLSLVNGEIRYVNEDLTYNNITELLIDSLLLNQDFLKKLIEAIGTTEEVTMPTLVVDKLTLIWTSSNVSSFKTFIPKY